MFWISPVIPETGKAMNFEFCSRIYRIDRNKSPSKISGKVAVGPSNILRHPYIDLGRIVRSSLRYLGFLVQGSAVTQTVLYKGYNHNPPVASFI